MADFDAGGGGGHKKEKGKRSKKMSTRVDFTPMVDLAFLLITFFMLTTTMSKPQTMEINMPVKEDVPPEDQTKFPECCTMTILLSENDKIYYYMGLTDPKIETTDFGPDGIRKLLVEKNGNAIKKINALKEKFRNKQLTEDKLREEIINVKKDFYTLKVIIKSDEKSRYKNLVDILDEMSITEVGSYSVADITPQELEMIHGPATPAPAEGTPAAQ